LTVFIYFGAENDLWQSHALSDRGKKMRFIWLRSIYFDNG